MYNSQGCRPFRKKLWYIFNFAARWRVDWLNDDQKQTKQGIYEQCLDYFKNNPTEFMHQFVTMYVWNIKVVKAVLSGKYPQVDSTFVNKPQYHSGKYDNLASNFCADASTADSWFLFTPRVALVAQMFWELYVGLRMGFEVRQWILGEKGEDIVQTASFPHRHL